MLSIDRWRKWQPSNKKFDDSPGREPSKPPIPTFEGFEGSIPRKTQNFTGPAANVQDTQATHFDHWVSERCVKSDRLFSAIGNLQIDFNVWAAEQGRKHCERPQFELLLLRGGYLVAEGLTSGLMLHSDLLADGYERQERITIQAETGVSK
jgi:hypothetical protein